MACEFGFQRDLGFVVTRFRGVVTDTEFVALYRSLLDHPDYEPGLGEVADLRSVDRFAVSTGALRTVSALIKARLAGTEAACHTTLIAPGDLVFGLGRMYGALSADGPEEVRVFRTLEAAAEALSLSPAVLSGVLASGRARAVRAATPERPHPEALRSGDL